MKAAHMTPFGSSSRVSSGGSRNRCLFVTIGRKYDFWLSIYENKKLLPTRVRFHRQKSLIIGAVNVSVMVSDLREKAVKTRNSSQATKNGYFGAGHVDARPARLELYSRAVSRNRRCFNRKARRAARKLAGGANHR